MASGRSLSCTASPRMASTATPLWVVIFDRAGDLYGTTTRGGANDSGTAFELTPGSGGVWTETILYNFDGGLTGGPYAAMIFDAHGNLYGTTLGGGRNNEGK